MGPLLSTHWKKRGLPPTGATLRSQIRMIILGGGRNIGPKKTHTPLGGTMGESTPPPRKSEFWVEHIFNGKWEGSGVQNICFLEIRGKVALPGKKIEGPLRYVFVVELKRATGQDRC